MKRLAIKTLAGLLLVIGTGTSFAQTATEALQAYVKSGDQQDVATMEKLLHKDFVSHYTFVGDDDVNLMKRKTFVDMFRTRKFGGNQRQFIQRSSLESKNLVLIDAQLAGPDMVFDGFFVMQQESGKWQLKEEYLIVKPQS